MFLNVFVTGLMNIFYTLWNWCKNNAFIPEWIGIISILFLIFSAIDRFFKKRLTKNVKNDLLFDFIKEGTNYGGADLHFKCKNLSENELKNISLEILPINLKSVVINENLNKSPYILTIDSLPSLHTEDLFMFNYNPRTSSNDRTMIFEIIVKKKNKIILKKCKEISNSVPIDPYNEAKNRVFKELERSAR